MATEFPEALIGRLHIFEAPYASQAVNFIPITSHDEFLIGRDKNSCRYDFADPHLSKKHLRIHCIVFEEDEVTTVPPLVYAQDLSTNGTLIKHGNSSTGISQAPIHMPRRDEQRAVLLTHGDELYLTPGLLLAFEQPNSGYPMPGQVGFNAIQRQEQAVSYISCANIGDSLLIISKLFRDQYSLTSRPLGAGGHATVYVAIHKQTQQQLACKVVDLREVREKKLHRSDRESKTGTEYWPVNVKKHIDQCRQSNDWLEKQFREFDLLKDLSHPNIIRLERVFWSTNTLYIFQELVTGGDLFSFIASKGGYGADDAEVAVIVRQILEAVNYLHERNIVHRDLKPDNILMTSNSIHSRVVLADFDAARLIPRSDKEGQTGRRMFSTVGTYEFVAPEIYGRNQTISPSAGYSKAVDMWSVGCITAMLLTGDVIFIDRDNPEYATRPKKVILDLAADCNLDVLDHGFEWRKVGRRPKDFIRRLLSLDETRRMTAKQALQHKWLTNGCYAARIDALYQRSIGNWQPNRRVFGLVTQLNSRTASAGITGQNSKNLLAPLTANPPLHLTTLQ